MAQTFEFTIGIDDFDASLLPADARTPGTPAFTSAVQRFVADQFGRHGGWAKIAVDDTARVLRVSWGPGDKEPDRLESAVGLLQSGKYPEAVRTLEVLRFQTPDDPAVFYNLGMALSDMGQLPTAVAHLRRAVELSPRKANAHVALGVALVRSGRLADAAASLREGSRLDPKNQWAYRNLGACLLMEEKFAEAEPPARRAVDLAPDDPQARLGLGQALMGLGRDEEADEHLIRAIDLDPHGRVGEVAKEARSKLAQKSLRSATPTGERPDAVMYLVGALDQFAKLSDDQVRQIGFEIAMLGMKGLDTNDPAQKYALKSVPGKFSGLHAVCLMYAAFKRVAPDHNVGFDLSREYEAAKAMRSQTKRG